ncbi:protein of unknown function [Paraburkholderia dioscoreae]|uniref:Uncharacterized protein n=1 Tax=Paraburkholderia dioscoreae TaxID=2604047 RepID=A0A5Q4Z1X7_9BURK|nr:protein of unknown function [Paraburkholderia dioscoreae]
MNRRKVYVRLDYCCTQREAEKGVTWPHSRGRIPDNLVISGLASATTTMSLFAKIPV